MSNTAQGTAMDRINALLDENSFVEIGAMVTKRSTDFNLSEQSVPSDGVITGYGTINYGQVYVYSQDASALGGSVGEMHARKIAKIYDLAMKTGAPVIALVDCAGLRLQEATDALAAFGSIYKKQAMASGVIPQITAVLGNCGGGASVLASMSDFTFMTEKGSSLFVNSPNTIDGNYTEKCNTAGAAFQAEAGNVDYVGKDEADVFEKIRLLCDLLPMNNEDEAADDVCEDDLNREVPGFASEYADPAKALSDISDGNVFFEIKKEFAKEMVTGFIKLNGMTVGAVANRAAVMDDNFKAVEKLDSTLTAKGCYKAEKFVEFCDSFNIPVLTLTNVKGYAATMGEERALALAVAKLTYAFTNATVPKVNLIVDKAYGSAYITMNSKHIGADLVFALDSAQIGMMDAKQAVQIIYAKELEGEKDQASFIDKKAAEYSKVQSGAESAAKRGYVDSLIAPASVRKQLVYAFEMLYTKREDRPAKKHGTV